MGSRVGCWPVRKGPIYLPKDPVKSHTHQIQGPPAGRSSRASLDAHWQDRPKRLPLAHLAGRLAPLQLRGGQADCQARVVSLQ
jgi:hypothetical protein